MKPFISWSLPFAPNHRQSVMQINGATSQSSRRIAQSRSRTSLGSILPRAASIPIAPTSRRNPSRCSARQLGNHRSPSSMNSGARKQRFDFLMDDRCRERVLNACQDDGRGDAEVLHHVRELGPFPKVVFARPWMDDQPAREHDAVAIQPGGPLSHAVLVLKARDRLVFCSSGDQVLHKAGMPMRGFFFTRSARSRSSTASNRSCEFLVHPVAVDDVLSGHGNERMRMRQPDELRT